MSRECERVGEHYCGLQGDGGSVWGGPEHCGTLVTAGNLALSLYDQGMYAEAEQMQREARA